MPKATVDLSGFPATHAPGDWFGLKAGIHRYYSLLPTALGSADPDGDGIHEAINVDIRTFAIGNPGANFIDIARPFTGQGYLRLNLVPPAFPSLGSPPEPEIGQSEAAHLAALKTFRDNYLAAFTLADLALRSKSFTTAEILADNKTILGTLTFDAPVNVGLLLDGVADLSTYDTTVISSTRIEGVHGGSGDDVIVAHSGNTSLFGNDGNDVFDWQTNGLTVGATPAIHGGANKTSNPVTDVDILKLPGTAADYRFDVEFSPFPGEYKWAKTTTEIERAPFIGPATAVLRVDQVEKATFSAPVANQVSLYSGFVDIPVGFVGAEMLKLAEEVYGPKPTLGHFREALAWEFDLQSDPKRSYVSNVAEKAAGRGWHRLEAMELGIKPADYGEHGDLHYSLVKGFYAARAADGFLDGDHPEANALVLTGMVKGKRTLAIAFRGTDQIADFQDYLDFKFHYAKFQPLTDAIDRYIKDAANGIQQVLVSGHSLGAGIAQWFMNEHEGDARFKAYTDGSPGGDEAKTQTTDPRIVNFIHTDDAVTSVPTITAAPFNPVSQAALAAIGTGVTLASVASLNPAGAVAGLTVIKLLTDGHRKFRVGSEVFITSAADDSIGLVEHDKALYVRDLVNLYKLADDGPSPFHAHDLAKSLREETIYAGADIQITPGSEFGDIIRPHEGDDYVLGGKGDDLFVMPDNNVPFSGPFAADGKTRHLDGGDGNDRLLLPYMDSSELRWVDDPADTSFRELRLDNFFIGTSHVARIYRTELLILPHDANRIYLMRVDGTPVTPERIDALGTHQLSQVHPYTLLGDGSMIAIGTAHGDILVFGRGQKSISTGSSVDIVMAGEGAVGAGAPLAAGEEIGATIDSGSGDDIVTGGDYADVLIGADGKDILRGGGGGDAILGGFGDDTLDGEEGGDFIFGGAFTAGGTFSASSGKDKIAGGAGNDGLWGMDGDDALTGGEGADGLVGGAGDDRLEGAAGGDFLFGGDFSFTDGSRLPGSGNDVLSGGDGNDALYGFDGADMINGDAGDDYVEAGAGDDLVNGGASNDTLLGEDGADTMFGGAGFDYLYGGAGADVFSFRKLDSYDTIWDFSVAQGDRLRIDPAFGFANVAQAQAALTGFIFEGVAYTVLDIPASIDRLIVKGVAHTAWTVAMVEIA